MFPGTENTDGFRLDFDGLIDEPSCVSTDQMSLKLVAPQHNPFALDLSLDHTKDHIECPACRGANAALQLSSADLANMTFAEAGRAWMLLRRQDQELRERTHVTTQDYINQLSKFFGALRLRDITPGHIRAYQIARLNNLLRIDGVDASPWKHQAGGTMINHELSVVGQMLRFAHLWHRIKPYYFPFEQPKWSPREILTEDQEEALWKTAAKHPEAALAYWVATITNNTTAAGIELRGLRLRHLHLDAVIGEIYIPEDSVKNESRPRRIALNKLARWAVGECLKRAIKCGSCEPDHYLFPFWVKRNVWDPTRAASRFFLRKSWAKLRIATGFHDLKPHDLRHHCITRLLENDNNPETVIAIAGHVSRKMLEYYAHQRTRVKYAAVLTLEKKPVAPEATPAARKHA